MTDVHVVGVEEPIGVLCSHGMCASDATHEATLRREAVVRESAMEMNRRGVDFQPGQRAALSSPKRRGRRSTKR
jgi:hypothetical protein